MEKLKEMLSMNPAFRESGEKITWLEDYAHLYLCRYIWSLGAEIQVHTHTQTHTRLTLSYSSHCPPHWEILFFRGGAGTVALQLHFGLLAASQGANKTLLYLWRRAAFRLSCRRSDETQRSHTVTGCYSLNEERPLEIAASRPGGSRRFSQTGESTNLQTDRITDDNMRMKTSCSWDIF